MAEIEHHEMNAKSDEISLKEVVLVIRNWVDFLLKKWIIISLFGISGGILGLIYAVKQKAVYTATLSFAMEDDKSGGGGLAGAMGLASSLGLDLGTSAGGAFSGANLIQLMKSRTLVEKALLNPIVIRNKKKSIADFYIEFNETNKGWNEKQELKNIKFQPLPDRSKFSLQQDSILGTIYSSITGPNGLLSVSQKDKKISIISIEVKASNEMFAKVFTESIAKEVSEFYIETKSKKARANVSILQKQTDSVRAELYEAIMGVASSSDNTFNLNPALNIKRTPTSKRQIDVQANTAILTQLVTNLEMAKVTLLRETPLIQVIDKPILPLKKEKVGKLMSMIRGGVISGFLIVLILTLQRLYKRILKD